MEEKIKRLIQKYEEEIELEEKQIAELKKEHENYKIDEIIQNRICRIITEHCRIIDAYCRFISDLKLIEVIEP